MKLIIHDYGTVISHKANMFRVYNKAKNLKDEFSANLVKQIIIASGSSVTSRVVKLAMDHDIDILYVNKFGMPYARIYPCRLGGTTLTRKVQAEAYNSQKSVILSKAFVEGKTSNQYNLLKSLSKNRKSTDLEKFADKILELQKKIESLDGDNIDDIRDYLLGIEGASASMYFQALATILPFNGRDRKSSDQVNIMLNYGYGILYSEIEKSCITAGLDPYLGYFHKDRYGKPSMVLDLIEEFRQPVVDRAIITLFSHRIVSNKDFQKIGDSMLLSGYGRKKVIDAIMKRLSIKVNFKGRNFTLGFVITDHARDVAKFLLSEKDDYTPFTPRW